MSDETKPKTGAPQGAPADPIADEIGKRTRELATLGAVISAVGRTQEVGAILREVRLQIVQRLALPAGGILLHESGTARLRLIESWNLPLALGATWRSVPLDGFHAEQVFRTGRPRVVVDPGELADFRDVGVSPEEIPWSAYLCVPLGPPGNAHGLLALFGGPSQSFGPREVAFYQALGELVGLAVDRAIESERRGQAYGWLRGVLDAVGDGVVTLMVDEHGEHVVSTNRRFTEIFDVKPEQILGREEDFVLEVFAYATADPGSVRAMLDTPGAETTITVLRLPQPRSFKVSSVPLTDHAGRHLGKLWMVGDPNGETAVRSAASAGSGTTMAQEEAEVEASRRREIGEEWASEAPVLPAALRRVLVCEKDPGVLGLLRGLLLGEGFEIMTAATVDEAVVALRAGSLDAAIVEFMLDRPGIEILPELGWDALEVESRIVFVAEWGEKSYPNVPLPPVVAWLRNPKDRTALGGLVRSVAPGGNDGGRPAILVVDDDEARSRRVADLLESLGAEVEAVSSGLKAVRACPRLRPNLILMNLKMPDSQALFVMETLRKAWGLGRTRVALYSDGDLDEKDRGALAQDAARIFARSRIPERDFLARILARLVHLNMPGIHA